jgi:hypothetical protein
MVRIFFGSLLGLVLIVVGMVPRFQPLAWEPSITPSSHPVPPAGDEVPGTSPRGLLPGS